MSLAKYTLRPKKRANFFGPYSKILGGGRFSTLELNNIEDETAVTRDSTRTNTGLSGSRAHIVSRGAPDYSWFCTNSTFYRADLSGATPAVSSVGSLSTLLSGTMFSGIGSNFQQTSVEHYETGFLMFASRFDGDKPGLFVADVSDPLSPVFHAGYDSGVSVPADSDAFNLCVKYDAVLNVAFVVSRYFITAFDMTDPTTPTVLARFDCSAYHSDFVTTVAYDPIQGLLFTWVSSNNRMRVFDVADPTSISYVSLTTMNGVSGSSTTMEVDPFTETLFFTRGSGTYEIQAWDYSNTASVTLVDTVEVDIDTGVTAAACPVDAIWVDPARSLLFGFGGWVRYLLVVYDISDPNNMTLVDHYYDSGNTGYGSSECYAI